MKIVATIEETTLEGDRGVEVEGVTATCPRCGHETESYGTSVRSVQRCLALLKEECPKDEQNFYVAEHPDPRLLYPSLV